jgi:uncharacterized LabA/DUF88 family protein
MSVIDSAVSGRNVALYWDFENLHAALFEEKYGAGAYAGGDMRFKPQDPLIDVQAILEFAASFGALAVNRAYCNWQFYGRYRHALLQGAVELIQLFPPGTSAKNGADIKLSLDAHEDVLRLEHISTVVIVGGDSDFMPLSQKIKAAGRTVVGVGTRKSTNRHWAQSCHEFRFYENLVAVDEPEQPVEPQAVPAVAVDPRQVAFETVRRAIKLLAESKGDPWVNKAALLPMVKRLDPTFDPKEFGFSPFSNMIKTMEGSMVEVRKGQFDQQVRLQESGSRELKGQR